MNDKLLKNCYDEINKLKPVTLYENSNGTPGNITLLNSVNNYSYIEIFSNWYDNFTLPSVRLSKNDIKNNTFTISFLELGDNKLIASKKYSISGNSITKTSFSYYIVNTGETSTWDVLKITKVIGYK